MTAQPAGASESREARRRRRITDAKQSLRELRIELDDVLMSLMGAGHA